MCNQEIRQTGGALLHIVSGRDHDPRGIVGPARRASPPTHLGPDIRKADVDCDGLPFYAEERRDEQHPFECETTGEFAQEQMANQQRSIYNQGYWRPAGEPQAAQQPSQQSQQDQQHPGRPTPAQLASHELHNNTLHYMRPPAPRPFFQQFGQTEFMRQADVRQQVQPARSHADQLYNGNRTYSHPTSGNHYFSHSGPPAQEASNAPGARHLEHAGATGAQVRQSALDEDVMWGFLDVLHADEPEPNVQSPTPHGYPAQVKVHSSHHEPATHLSTAGTPRTELWAPTNAPTPTLAFESASGLGGPTHAGSAKSIKRELDDAAPDSVGPPSSASTTSGASSSVSGGAHAGVHTLTKAYSADSIFVAQDPPQAPPGRRRRTKEASTRTSTLTSLEVFLSYVCTRKDKTGAEYLDCSGILSRACYEKWMSSRRRKPRFPEECFRKTIISHITVSDKASLCFPKPVEASLLTELRKKRIWPCFAGRCYEGTDRIINIGQKGLRALGFHERAESTDAADGSPLPQPLKRASSDDGIRGFDEPEAPKRKRFPSQPVLSSIARATDLGAGPLAFQSGSAPPRP